MPEARTASRSSDVKKQDLADQLRPTFLQILERQVLDEQVRS
jgi:hypothetical protein